MLEILYLTVWDGIFYSPVVPVKMQDAEQFNSHWYANVVVQAVQPRQLHCYRILRESSLFRIDYHQLPPSSLHLPLHRSSGTHKSL